MEVYLLIIQAEGLFAFISMTISNRNILSRHRQTPKSQQSLDFRSRFRSLLRPNKRTPSFLWIQIIDFFGSHHPSSTFFIRNLPIKSGKSEIFSISKSQISLMKIDFHHLFTSSRVPLHPQEVLCVQIIINNPIHCVLFISITVAILYPCAGTLLLQFSSDYISISKILHTFRLLRPARPRGLNLVWIPSSKIRDLRF